MKMLTILDAVLPPYLNHLHQQIHKKDAVNAQRTELAAIHYLSSCMKVLITNCEALAK